jgi:tRNA(fMet)-specific endonuclease VapC
MDVCIDSNVFSHIDFLQWVAENKVNVYLPSMAYMESAYHEGKRHGSSLASFISMLAGLKVTIVPFDNGLALIASKNAAIKHDMREHGRDHAIAAYAYKRKIPMITNNKKHFICLKEVYTPDEFMQKFTRS